MSVKAAKSTLSAQSSFACSLLAKSPFLIFHFLFHCSCFVLLLLLFFFFLLRFLVCRFIYIYFCSFFLFVDLILYLSSILLFSFILILPGRKTPSYLLTYTSFANRCDFNFTPLLSTMLIILIFSFAISPAPPPPQKKSKKKKEEEKYKSHLTDPKLTPTLGV